MKNVLQMCCVYIISTQLIITSDDTEDNDLQFDMIIYTLKCCPSLLDLIGEDISHLSDGDSQWLVLLHHSTHSGCKYFLRTAENKTTSERTGLSVIVTVTETWVKSFLEFWLCCQKEGSFWVSKRPHHFLKCPKRNVPIFILTFSSWWSVDTPAVKHVKLVKTLTDRFHVCVKWKWCWLLVPRQ
jgi:hypothetical protein